MNYQRRLPHRFSDQADLFITWHLHSTLPAAHYPPPGKMSSGEAFVWMDRYLDTTRNGPLWLLRPEVAEVIENAIYREVELRHCDLHAFTIMANHVHALLRPLVPPATLVQSLKGFSARQANRLLHGAGDPFWQNESYDHWIRNSDEFARVKRYIENNPVKAGLVSQAEEYRWSSAWQGSRRLKTDAAT